jgi:hypothetical protein
VLVIVKPDTVVRWHRAGFKLHWNWISRHGSRRGQPAVDAEVRDLIRRMTFDNGWGAPRIHGELLMLGFDVSERTISRHLHGLHRRPEARQSWLTFLHNHREVIAAMDRFVVFTVSVRWTSMLRTCRSCPRIRQTEFCLPTPRPCLLPPASRSEPRPWPWMAHGPCFTHRPE